jgi:very-short-patch-repair endonuclease
VKIAKNNCLVAIMNSKTDFAIANTYYWYRIPEKNAPEIVRNNSVKYIAFYHTKVFEKEKFTIQWFSQVEKISLIKRKDLFPEQKRDLKRNNKYFKIEIGKLNRLPNVIFSQRPRRILFIPTSEEKLFGSQETNFLFNDSPLEEKLWSEFVKSKITAERQYFIEHKKDQNFILDFAIFCKSRNINVECDGDEYHTEKEDVFKDKKRNNILESKGWSVLRFTRDDINNDLETSVGVVNDTINKYGGIEDVKNLGSFIYINDNGTYQIRLFS